MKFRILRHIRFAGFSTCVLSIAFQHNVQSAQPPLLGVQQISAGYATTCAVVNGAAQCWGAYAVGQIFYNGNPYFYLYNSAKPAPVPGLGSGVTQVAAGYAHVCAVVHGSVQCWGDNSRGQLGSSGPFSDSPVAVTGLSAGVSSVSTGGDSTCAIVNAGALCWGDNIFGQLGNSSISANYSSTPVTVDGLSSGVSKIVAGAVLFSGYAGHTCAIVNGGAQCWGANDYGQLGSSTSPPYSFSQTPTIVTGLNSGVTDIAAGLHHTCAVVGGSAQCWGSDDDGQLGNSTSYGYPIYSQTPVMVQGLSTGVTAIVANFNHTCALLYNDATHFVSHPVKCWGNNSFGQQGDGSVVGSGIPMDVAFAPPLAAGDFVSSIAAGAQHVCATVSIRGIAKMQCWGDNESGQLGVTGGDVNTPIPVTVSGLVGTMSVGTGSSASHSCAVVSGAAKCWGSNEYSQLGDGGYLDRSIAAPVSGLIAGVTEIAVGQTSTCAVVSGGAKCWGSGLNGELGDNNQYGSSTPVDVSGLTAGVIRIATGGGDANFNFGGHACAVVNGGVQCWGANDSGQLGSNAVPASDGSYSLVPVAVTGLNTGVTDIAAGFQNTCAIVGAGVQCWGASVGNSSYPSGSSTPVTVTGWNSGVAALASGQSHTCAIVNTAVQCWGSNAYGQLGDGLASGTSSLTPVSVVGLSTGVTAISAGAFHTCAIANSGVQCWGSNNAGQLGTTNYSVPGNCAGNCNSTPLPVTGLGTGAISIGAGASHTCAVLSSGAEKCWGSDYQGELGDNRFLFAEIPQPVVAGDEIFHDGFNGN